MRRGIWKVVVGIVLLLGAGAACSSGGGSRADPASIVRIKGFLFSPDTTRVVAGTTVTWRNLDDIAHTVTAGAPEAPDGTFDSGDRIKEQAFEHTFTQAGTFAYFCRNHNGMRGEVTVSERG